jgi:hypothetical protein
LDESKVGIVRRGLVKVLRNLCLFIPGCAVLGVAVSLFLQLPTPLRGIEVGACVGLFFGLLFADTLPRSWSDLLLGPDDTACLDSSRLPSKN